MNKEGLLFNQNKNPSVFAKPSDSNSTANSGYDREADNQYGGNGYDRTDSQYGRYGYDHQADNQYVGNGYDHADNQYDRYGYGHQADYQYSGNGCNHWADDQYGGCGGDQADNGRYGVNRHIGSNQRNHFDGNGSYINRKYFWGNHQNNTGIQQPKQSLFTGRVGMNAYNAGIIHCDYIPYNACFTGMHCIVPLFR